MNQELPKYLRPKDAAAFLAVAISTLWRWTQKGLLPKPKRLSRRCSVWEITDLQRFVERQRAANEAR